MLVLNLKMKISFVINYYLKSKQLSDTGVKRMEQLTIFSTIRKILIVTLSSMTMMVSLNAKENLVFSGGPAGGTFQIVANSIQVYGPVKKSKKYRVRAQSSAGSVENLRKINSGKAHFGVVYSGHVYLGREGKMKNDPKKYTDVMAISYLYGAPAQLVVKKKSGIKSVKDLAGKKVGVGNAGSGAFANSELFFTHMGVWDSIKRNAMGYNDAAQAFGNNQLDAFWLFTAFPSGAVIMAAQTNDIALVDLGKEAANSGFYDKFPYFTKVAIPGGTYKGVNSDSPSFQDSALWVANTNVPAETVYDMLNIIYTDEGLAHMKAQKKTFEEMEIGTGINGIVTPMHPGAEKFWREKGLLK